MLSGTKIIYKVLKLNKFLNTNKDIDLLNHNHKIKYKDIKGKECIKDFDTLYEDSVQKALDDIKKINKLLE